MIGRPDNQTETLDQRKQTVKAQIFRRKGQKNYQRVIKMQPHFRNLSDFARTRTFEVWSKSMPAKAEYRILGQGWIVSKYPAAC